MKLARWLSVTIVAAALWSIGSPAHAAPPANDKPSAALRIPALPFVYEQSTAGATAENWQPSSCGIDDASVWFKFTAHDYGTAVAQTRGSSFDTALGVFYGQNGKPTYDIGCSDDSARQRSVVTFSTSPGATYFIEVSGFLGETGSLKLAVNRGGKLAGVARDGSTGRPVPNACILFEGPVTYYGGYYAFTSPTGYYELNGLASGEYRPINNPYGCGQYKARPWDRPALVAEGFATRGQEVVLDSGVIQGNVFDQRNHAPVENECVAGVDADGNYVTYGQSTPTGYYRMVAPPGPLRVAFQDCSGLPRFAPEFYDGALGLADATVVNVGAGITTSHIDASLLRAASLVGNVRDARTGGAIGACVQALLANTGDTVGYGFTFGSPSGLYRIDGLPPADVIVQARECTGDSSHAPAWYPHASLRGGAEAVGLQPGVSRRADFRLDRGGRITGVLRRDTGGVLSNECVLAFAPDGERAFAQTSPTGLYLLPALARGKYRVRFGGCNSTAPEWYRDAGDRAAGLELLVNVGDRVTANASLASEGRFRATVVDPSSSKAPRVCVAAAPLDLEDFYDFQFPTQTGLVGFGDIGATKYEISAFDCGDELEGGFEQELGTFQGVPGQVKNLGALRVKLRDRDGDAVPDRVDNCPLTPNANQADVNNDDLGNVCDKLHRGS